MKKRRYIKPNTYLTILDEESELLVNTIHKEEGTGAGGPDSWAKQGSGFDSDDETAEVGSDASGWFDDSKSDW